MFVIIIMVFVIIAMSIIMVGIRYSVCEALDALLQECCLAAAALEWRQEAALFLGSSLAYAFSFLFSELRLYDQ